MPRPAYTLEGFDAFRRGLKKANLTGELKTINQEAAVTLIADAERRKQSLEGRYPAYEKVTFKPSATANRVQILVKGDKRGRRVAYAAEFGAHTHPVYGRSLSQETFKQRVWPRWGGNKDDAGYMVYPALRERESDIRDIYTRAMDKVLLQIAAEI